MKIKIRIFLKEGVLDPQAKAVEKALHALDFNDVSELKIAKEISFTLKENDKENALVQARAMCEELLANTVIEDYEIQL